MSKFILFSAPLPNVLDEIKKELFKSSKMKVAYMTSDGANPVQKYTDFWKEYIEQSDCVFVEINNSVRGDSAEAEKTKLLACDALIISGGNTYVLLDHLNRSGLGEAVKQLSQMGKTVAGFSAGAIVLSPDIEILKSVPGYDDPTVVDLDSLAGLDLIPFDVFAHYVETQHREDLDKYEQSSTRELRRVGDDEFVVWKT